jgi:hypothetical protein
LTKVLILRNQNAIGCNCALSNIVVLFAGRHFGNGNNIMTRETKRAYDREIAAFIGEKAHRLSSRAPFRRGHNDGFLVRQRVGRITNRGLDILDSEARVGIEQVVSSRPFTELSKNQLNRDASPANDRLSHHHLWIDFYAISNCHRASQKCFQSPCTTSSMAFKSRLTSVRSEYTVHGVLAKLSLFDHLTL